MITKLKIYLYTTQPESHPHMTITTCPLPNPPISTKTRLKRIYVHFVFLSSIQYPIPSSSTPLNHRKGNVGIQWKARSHRDMSPTERVSQCHLLLYFWLGTIVQARQDQLRVGGPTMRCGEGEKNPRSYLNGGNRLMVHRCLVVRERLESPSLVVYLHPRKKAEAGQAILNGNLLHLLSFILMWVIWNISLTEWLILPFRWSISRLQSIYQTSHHKTLVYTLSDLKKKMYICHYTYW